MWGMSPLEPLPTCRHCGRPIAPKGPDRYVHRGGGHVAACDLDADHPAEPASLPEAAPSDAGA